MICRRFNVSQQLAARQFDPTTWRFLTVGVRQSAAEDGVDNKFVDLTTTDSAPSLAVATPFESGAAAHHSAAVRSV